MVQALHGMNDCPAPEQKARGVAMSYYEVLYCERSGSLPGADSLVMGVGNVMKP
jgi:hypothetical protein